MKLSIVATLYQSAPYIKEFCQRIEAECQSIGEPDYEIILVNDGSPDDSLELALQERARNAKIKIVDLSRNFGHHKAIMTGLQHTRGERVFLIDCDLEEEPEWLSLFMKEMAASESDVVYGVQKSRKGGFFERVSGLIFYEFLRRLTKLTFPNNIVVVRLMSRRYVDSLLLHDEREMFLAGLWDITGYAQTPVYINKKSRGGTTYTLRRKISQLVNSVTSFSNMPLIFIFYFGMLVFLLSGLYAVYILYHWLYFSSPPDGWTSLIISVWLLGGLIIQFLGVIGIYISKVFSETKRRPYTIIRKFYADNE